MKLPTTAHTEQPWLVHTLAPEFTLEDVWALPTPGGPNDLPRLVEAFHTLPFPDGSPLVVRALWAARLHLGEWFGWDRAESGVGEKVPSLRERLPAALRSDPPGAPLEGTPFTFVYQQPDEYVAEMANATVHALLHLGWVPDGAGGHRGQLAVLVRPQGRLGPAYMMAIKPFRHLSVYPALLRALERRWAELAAEGSDPAPAPTSGAA